MPGGATYDIVPIWQRDNEAGFSFVRPVDVQQLIKESGDYPKRGLRLGLCFPVTIHTLTQRCDGLVENVSQQGARIKCRGSFALDQAIMLEAPDLAGAPRKVRAKVRWRRDDDYGLVFDDTFTLGDFARFAARLQAPALLTG